MFDKKKDSLIYTAPMNSKTGNKFVKAGLRESALTYSHEGALKYSTSGDAFVDNFASISLFRLPRNYADVARDMNVLWSISPINCLKLMVYIRMITRSSKAMGEDGMVVFKGQKGQGLKHEFIMRAIWLAINHPMTFKANVHYFIAAGSWNDLFQMLSYDLQYNGWDDRRLDWDFMYAAIVAGLENPDTTHLVRKYMPTIRNNKRCKTIEAQSDTLIGRWLARKMFPNEISASSYKAYRRMKSAGIAHEWQQLISKQMYQAINFDNIAGRALSKMVRSKFLSNQQLVEYYSDWVASKTSAKYTGYVHELFSGLSIDSEKHIKDTINAQFANLIETAKTSENITRLLVVRDISESMTARCPGTNTSAFDVAKAMALYFSEFMTGEFTGAFAAFNSVCKLYNWIGETPCDKWINDTLNAYASTDFLRVITLLISIKKRFKVAESEFPEGILCISDGEFSMLGHNNTTSFNKALEMLREAGFSKEYVDNFKIILWDVPNEYYGVPSMAFEDFADAPNFFYLSGYDPSAVSFLMGAGNFDSIPHNAKELFDKVMDQDLLNVLKVYD